MNVLLLKKSLLVNKVEFLKKIFIFLSWTGDFLSNTLRLRGQTDEIIKNFP